MNCKSKRPSFPVTVDPLPNVERVNSIKILGVTIDNQLSVKDHVNNVCQAAAQNLYAIKLLKSHGLNQQSIYSVCQATVVARLVCVIYIPVQSSRETGRPQTTECPPHPASSSMPPAGLILSRGQSRDYYLLDL